MSSYAVAQQLAAGTDVNLVVGGKLETTYGSIKGSVMVGGLVKLHGPSVYGSLRGKTFVALDQYGTVQGAGGSGVTYGTTYSNPNTTITGIVQQATISLPLNFSQAKTDLTVLSARLRDLAPNGTTTVQYGGITLSGSDANRNIFRVRGSDLANCSGFTPPLTKRKKRTVRVHPSTFLPIRGSNGQIVRE